MHSTLRTAGAVLFWLTATIPAPGPADAQLIGLKTVPIATGEQFRIHPSANLGMGGVSIALDDALLDPYVNPARGARGPAVAFDATPLAYTASADQGIGGLTLPVSMLARGQRHFGGFGVAFQQLSTGNRGRLNPIVPDGEPQSFLGSGTANRYAHAQLGRTGTIGGRPVSAGASISWAGLNALDGVDRLYASASRVDQQGHVVDYRVGLLADLQKGRTLDAVLLHNRLDMSHRITYAGWGVQNRVEHNLDQTATSGLHLRYTQPLSQNGTRFGAIFTANVKDHPKIPTYDPGSVVRIPRDPGNSRAFNIGFGFSNADENGSFGIDVVFEPAWSHTWADTTVAIVSVIGRSIPKGAKTVDNRFVFTNFALAAGLTRSNERRSFQAGLQIKSVSYTLDQTDFVRERTTDASESWIEWRPTWGFTARTKRLQLSYTGHITARGFPWTTDFDNGPFERPEMADPQFGGGGDFLVPITERVDFGEYWVFSNQFSITVPIRR